MTPLEDLQYQVSMIIVFMAIALSLIVVTYRSGERRRRELERKIDEIERR